MKVLKFVAFILGMIAGLAIYDYFTKFNVAIIADSKDLNVTYVQTIQDKLNEEDALKSGKIDTHIYYGMSAKQIHNNIKDKNFRKYKYVIVWGGVNKISHYNETLAYMQSIYSKLKEDDTKVIAVTLNPWLGHEKSGYKNLLRTKSLNRWIKNEAVGVWEVADIYDLLEDPDNPDHLRPDLTEDKLYLTDEGQKMVGKQILKTMGY